MGNSILERMNRAIDEHKSQHGSEGTLVLSSVMDEFRRAHWMALGGGYQHGPDSRPSDGYKPNMYRGYLVIRGGDFGRDIVVRDREPGDLAKAAPFTGFDHRIENGVLFGKTGAGTTIAVDVDQIAMAMAVRNDDKGFALNPGMSRITLRSGTEMHVAVSPDDMDEIMRNRRGR